MVLCVIHLVSLEEDWMTQTPDPQLDPEPPAVAAPPDAPVATEARPGKTTGTRGKIIIVGAAVAVAALGGGAIWGGVVTSHDNTVAGALQAHVSQLEGRVTALQGQLARARRTAAQASQAAQSATTTAQAKAAAQYASRMTSLAAAERRVAAQQKALRAALGQVQASAISADGVYVVGSDIKPGIWHTSGGGQCYYAILNSTNTSDIIDNNNFTGPDTVDVSGAHAFDISGGCTWVRTG